MSERLHARCKAQGAASRAVRAVFAACALALTSQLAAAGEYCVTCSGPAAMYACLVAGEDPSAPANPRHQLFCIQELARAGGHEQCAVPRSAPKPCPGVARTVALPQLPAQPPVTSVDGDAVPDGAANETLVPKTTAAEIPGDDSVAPAKPPKTVEELANQTVKASQQSLKKAGEIVTGTAEQAGDQVEKAGSAVGSAAKKTWDCLTSFFSGC